MYEILPHTADVRIRLEASSLRELFEDAGRAVGDLSGVVTLPDNLVIRCLRIDSVDQGSLLVDLLNEIVALLQLERISFDGFEEIAITTTTLEARARFRPAASWDKDIKAVTYHDAAVTHDGELWRSTIVVDV